MKKKTIIPITQFLFFVIIFGMAFFGNIMALLTWSELEDFSIKLMEDEEFTKNLSPECIENVVGLGWSAPNSNSFIGNNTWMYPLFGNATIEESGCNIIELAENEPLKALYRHVPQWYVSGDTIWLLIGTISPTLFTGIAVTLFYWPHTRNKNKFYKYESSFHNKNYKHFMRNIIHDIILWSWIAMVWAFSLYVMLGGRF